MKALCRITQTRLAEDENGVIWVWCDVCLTWERIYNFTWHMRNVHYQSWRAMKELAKEMR